LKQSNAQIASIERGGYVLLDCEGEPQVILIATGSEVQLAVAAAQQMTKANGVRTRVVSMPCCERFLAQPAAYQQAVLPKQVRARIAIEAAASDYWYRFVGLDGAVIGLDRFGVSAPAEDAFTDLGFTVEHLLEKMREVIEQQPC
jgi:transketolase